MHYQKSFGEPFCKCLLNVPLLIPEIGTSLESQDHIIEDHGVLDSAEYLPLICKEGTTETIAQSC
jgi:hypothetical protein